MWNPDDADGVWDELRAEFTEPELVELGYCIGFTFGGQPWLRTLGSAQGQRKAAIDEAGEKAVVVGPNPTATERHSHQVWAWSPTVIDKQEVSASASNWRFTWFASRSYRKELEMLVDLVKLKADVGGTAELLEKGPEGRARPASDTRLAGEQCQRHFRLHAVRKGV